MSIPQHTLLVLTQYFRPISELEIQSRWQSEVCDEADRPMRLLVAARSATNREQT
jgi:hypothetical protein